MLKFSVLEKGTDEKKSIKTKMANRLFAIKKTNLKDDKAIQDNLEIILKVVDHINGLDPEAAMVMGRPIDKFYLPQGLSCLINPKRIKVDPSLEACSDMLNREFVDKGETTYADFLNACDSLWQIVTRNSFSKTTLEELRKDASLNDMIFRSYTASNKMVLPSGDKPYLPIEINVHGLIDDRRRYVSVEDMVDDWILLELENIF